MLKKMVDALAEILSPDKELPPHQTAPIGDGKVIYLRYATADACEDLLNRSLELAEQSGSKDSGDEEGKGGLRIGPVLSRKLCRSALVACVRSMRTLDNPKNEIDIEQAQVLLIKASEHECEPFLRTELASKAMLLSGVSVPVANPTSEQPGTTKKS